MQPVRKVLAPIDLAVAPEVPVEHAIRAASAMGAELTLLYVADRRQHSPASRIEWPRNALGRTRTHCDIHRRVLPGRPAETIARYADLSGADLVVMTSENCGGWKRFWKRSVTAEVMASTRRPVWIADWRSMAAGYRFDCRNVLCVLTLDGSDDPVILQAEALAQRSGGELVLLSAVPESSEQLLWEVIPGLDRPLCGKLALERIREIGNTLSVPYKTSVMTSSLNRCVRVAARQHAASVVVASDCARGGAYSYGLDIRSVLRRLPCPLVSVAGLMPARRPIDGVIAEAPEPSNVLSS